MGRYASIVWRDYFVIFNENSFNERKNFFNDSIIRFLWQKFLNQVPEVVQDCVLTLVEDIECSKLKMIIHNIRSMESLTGLQIIPTTRQLSSTVCADKQRPV